MASGAACACNLPADSGDGVQGLALELYGSPKIAVANRAPARCLSLLHMSSFACVFFYSRSSFVHIFDHPSSAIGNS